MCVYVCVKEDGWWQQEEEERRCRERLLCGRGVDLFVWIMCLLNKSYHLGSPWTRQTCLNRECQSRHLWHPLLFFFFCLFCFSGISAIREVISTKNFRTKKKQKKTLPSKPGDVYARMWPIWVHNNQPPAWLTGRRMRLPWRRRNTKCLAFWRKWRSRTHASSSSIQSSRAGSLHALPLLSFLSHNL